MPEISDSEYRTLVRYQGIGTPDELEKLPGKVRDLEADNHKYRQEEKPALLAKIPKDGTVVITKAQADALAVYEALGRPEEVKATVEKVSTLEGDLAKRDREAARDRAAKALGIEGKDLAPFAGADALTYEVRDMDVTENGKTEKRRVAFVKDSEGKEHQLIEYGKEKWGRAFEAVVGSTQQTATTATGTTRYTTQTGKAQSRDGKVTAEDYRKATESTATYVI